jgi:hypothetical protein
MKTLLALTAALLACQPAPATAVAPPNIVFFLADDLGQRVAF